MKLAEFNIGDKGTVVAIRIENRDFRQKLLAMGLTPGTPFVLKRIAPLGDPVEIEVRGVDICLRKHEVCALEVEKTHDTSL